MNQLVRQVAYLNTREFPAPGRRRLELSTVITCLTEPRGTCRVPSLVFWCYLYPSQPSPLVAQRIYQECTRHSKEESEFSLICEYLFLREQRRWNPCRV